MVNISNLILYQYLFYKIYCFRNDVSVSSRFFIERKSERNQNCLNIEKWRLLVENVTKKNNRETISFCCANAKQIYFGDP